MGLMDSIKNITGIGDDKNDGNDKSPIDSIKDMATGGVVSQIQDSIKNYNTSEISNPTIRMIADTAKNAISNLKPDQVDDYIEKIMGMFKK